MSAAFAKTALNNSLLPNHHNYSLQSLSKACLHIREGDCKLSGLQDSPSEHSQGTNPENTAARRQDEQECIVVEVIPALLSTARDKEAGNRVRGEYWVVTRLDWLWGIGGGPIWCAKKVTGNPVLNGYPVKYFNVF